MSRGFLVGLLAAAVAVCMWGVQLPVAKDAFAVLDVFHMTSIRFGIPALLMLSTLVALEGVTALSYRGAFIPATLLGVVGMAGSPLLVFIGMSMSRAEHAAVIVALQPSIAAVALWLWRGIRPSNFTLACIALAFAGVVLVVTKGGFIFIETRRELFGDVIVLLGAACWVVYTMGMPKLGNWSIWRITALTMLPGAIATISLTEILVYHGAIVRPSFGQVTSIGWELAYLSLIGVIAGMLLWNFGNRRIGAQNATLLINLLPVATFVYRAAQGHRFENIELFGAALVVAALVANNLYLRRKMTHA